MELGILNDVEMANVQGDKERCLAVIGAFDTCKGCSANCHAVAKAQYQRDIKGFVEWLEEHNEPCYLDELYAGEIAIDKKDIESLKQLVENEHG